MTATRIFIHASKLPEASVFHRHEKLTMNSDLSQRICIQCHAPNAMHQSASEDDRTPRGVHEGMSCINCHSLHSNEVKNSCDNCHPAISNCKLDVKTMNTSYQDKKSPNNIHLVACKDCHSNEMSE